MELKREDYEERKRRMVNGQGDDEDHRLVTLYEQNGYSWDGSNSGQSPEPTPMTPTPSESEESSTVPSTGPRSRKDESPASSTARTAGKSGGQTGR